MNKEETVLPIEKYMEQSFGKHFVENKMLVFALNTNCQIYTRKFKQN